MPSFTTDFDFEVFCAGCGAGICNNCDTRTSHTRAYPQLTVEPCDNCIEAAEEKGREEMQARIEELEEQLAEAQQESLA